MKKVSKLDLLITAVFAVVFPPIGVPMFIGNAYRANKYGLK